MNLLAKTTFAIAEPNPLIAAQVQTLLDLKTKPRRSLGRLESLACQIAAVRGDACPALPEKAIVLMAADHGVADERVSAYPQEVTAQMLLNFARGGAAINVLARQAQARLVVADLGVKGELALADTTEIRNHRIAPGTRNFTREPAMTRQQALRALEVGITIASELAQQGIGLIGLGDMGIANTTSSSALTAALTGAAPEEVIGRGTGIDDAGMRRKLDAVRRGLALHRPDPADPVGTLAALGGFEIAGLAGIVLGAAAARVPVVIDGFICSTAALVAVCIAPYASRYLIGAHRSVEAGHRIVLRALDIEPLLDLQMRLGEGTGAALAMQLCDAALRILHEMATFDGAGVSDSGA
jgi:nicotinate-nucleotide--dimethylbenzimidazole phosphoribosyltransferase